MYVIYLVHFHSPEIKLFSTWYALSKIVFLFYVRSSTLSFSHFQHNPNFLLPWIATKLQVNTFRDFFLFFPYKDIMFIECVMREEEHLHARSFRYFAKKCRSFFVFVFVSSVFSLSIYQNYLRFSFFSFKLSFFDSNLQISLRFSLHSYCWVE